MMDLAITSGLIGAIITAAISLLLVRYHYRDLYAKSVSANRMEWINNFRDEVSTIIATIKILQQNGRCTEKENKYIYQAEKARAKLLTRLNMDTSKPGNEYNRVMADVLTKIKFRKACPIDQCYAEKLIALSRKILEPEWRRVKKEAGGKEK